MYKKYACWKQLNDGTRWMKDTINADTPERAAEYFAEGFLDEPGEDITVYVQDGAAEPRKFLVTAYAAGLEYEVEAL